MADGLIKRIEDLEKNKDVKELKKAIDSIAVDLALLPKPIDNKEILTAIHSAIQALLLKPEKDITPSLDKIASLLAEGDRGASGVTLDTTKAQIFFVDLQWLGVGRVRMGIFVNGVPIICHQFLNANSFPNVYMTTANLPIRFEIENTGVASVVSTMKQICASVISEGGFENDRGVGNAIANITSTAVTTRRAMLSIRPRATFNNITNRVKILVDEIEAIIGPKDVYYEIVYNPTFTGTPTWQNVDTNNSAVEYSIHDDVNSGAFTGGLVVENGFFSGRSNEQGDVLQRLPLTLDHAGANPIALSFVITSLSTATTASTSFSWTELY